MKRNHAVILTMVLTLAATFPLAAQVTVTDSTSYQTVDQMLLANEINESGEPYAEAIGYDLDVLDPFVPDNPDATAYVLGIENYEYSRYQLGVIIARSGMGLHMMWAPVIGEMAAMAPEDTDGMYTGGTPNGFKEDDVLLKMIGHFGMLANHTPPMHPWPQFGEFVAGTPRYVMAPDHENFAHDFATLRWDRSTMTMQLSPGAMGQTLMKQYLWAQDMLGGFHDANDEAVEPAEGVSPDLPGAPTFDPNNGVFYGGDGLDGFVGQVLTAEAINKVKNILTRLAFDGTGLGGVDPMTYDPASGVRYFPHLIAVEEAPVAVGMPPKPTGYTVADPTSWLFDQVSLLWGAESFTGMMNPSDDSSPAHMAYHAVFDGDPFPADMAVTGVPGPYDLMKGASKVVFQNMMAMHWVADSGTFTDTATLMDGKPKPGDRISTFNAGYAVMVLASFVPQFKGTPLETAAMNALEAQADFMMAHLMDATGGFSNGAFTNGTPIAGAHSVMAQAGGIRGLYAAWRATGEQKYLEAANAGYANLIANFWVPERSGFRTTLGASVARYTPKVVAALSGALREARLAGGKTEATSIYVAFWKHVTHTMQMAEAQATGESGGDSDGDGIPYIPEQAGRVAPVFAAEATEDLGGNGTGEDASGGVGPVACTGPYTTWVELVAHLDGATGSRWRSDLVVHNTSSAMAHLTLNLHSGAGMASWDTDAGPMAQLALEDVVGAMGASGKGALEICSDQPLEVVSRTYSDGQGGTVGQFLDGREGGGLVQGQTARLLGLRQSAGSFRTNFSVTNAGAADAQVRIGLYAATGTMVTSYDLMVPSGMTVQDLQPFAARAGQPDLGWGFATVTVTSGRGILATAYVIDSKTNDATAIPMKRR